MIIRLNDTSYKVDQCVKCREIPNPFNRIQFINFNGCYALTKETKKRLNVLCKNIMKKYNVPYVTFCVGCWLKISYTDCVFLLEKYDN